MTLHRVQRYEDFLKSPKLCSRNIDFLIPLNKREIVGLNRIVFVPLHPENNTEAYSLPRAIMDLRNMKRLRLTYI